MNLTTQPDRAALVTEYNGKTDVMYFPTGVYLNKYGGAGSGLKISFDQPNDTRLFSPDADGAEQVVSVGHQVLNRAQTAVNDAAVKAKRNRKLDAIRAALSYTTPNSVDRAEAILRAVEEEEQ